MMRGVAVCGLLAGLALAARPLGAQAGACAWRVHRDRTDTLRLSSDSLLFVDRPRILETPRGLELLGRTVVSRRDRDTLSVARDGPPGARLSGVRIAADGCLSPIPAPPMRSPVVGLEAVADEAGTVHAVWGSLSDSLPADRLPSYADELWYARYDGVRWTEPELVAEAENFQTSVSLVLVRSGPSLHVATITMDSAVFRLVLLHRTPTAWRRQSLDLPAGGRVLYVAGTPAGDGEAILAIVVGQRIPRADPRIGVWVARSSEQGSRWNHPHELYTQGNLGQHAPLFVANGRNETTLIWGEGPPGRPEIVTLHAATSRDRGATWLTHDPLSLPEVLLEYSAGPDAHGGVWVAVRYHSFRTMLCLAGAWHTTGLDPTAGGPAFVPIVGATSSGSLLSWTAIVGRAPSSAFATLVSPLPSHGCRPAREG